jgi:hypothetical protein
VPVVLSDAVLKCLAKDPEGRYTSMEELAAVLGGALSPGAQSKGICVSLLAEQTGKPDLNGHDASTAKGEETSVIRPSPDLNTGEITKPSIHGEADTPDKAMETESGIFSADGSDHGVHPLELDPPADLPPLESSWEMADSHSTPVTGEEEIPLSLKEMPVVEPEDEKAGRVASGAGKRLARHLLWLIPAILIAAAAVWKLGDGPASDLILRSTAPLSGPAQLRVVAEDGAMIYMDGKQLGEVALSGTFEVEPGEHSIVAQNPRFGKRSFIIKVEPGEMKEIEVRFGE